jgi:hypothetical protein
LWYKHQKCSIQTHAGSPVYDGDRIRVSFPEDIPEDAVRDALSDKNIEAGESEGETVAFFSKS